MSEYALFQNTDKFFQTLLQIIGWVPLSDIISFGPNCAIRSNMASTANVSVADFTLTTTGHINMNIGL